MSEKYTDDITRNRHKGNAESVAANARAQKGKDGQRILAYVRLMGNCTSLEISTALELPLHCVSPRLTDLKAAGWLVKTGEIRNGAAVLRAVSKQEREQTSFGFKANPTLKALGAGISEGSRNA